MKSQLIIKKHEGGRSAITIKIELDADETALMDGKACSRHVDSPKPIPCQFHQTPDPKISTVKGMPDLNGEPVKAYILPKARTVPLNRPMVGKSLLRVFIPGSLSLGFVNETELPRLQAWWKTTQEQIKAEMQARLFHLENDTSPEFVVAETVAIAKEDMLNPFGADETKGVRRRSFEDF